jgi:predicted ATPase
MIVVLTGPPGGGKTALLDELTARGHPTIREAATDVAAALAAAGDVEPWRRPDYTERIAALQVARRREAVGRDLRDDVPVVADRSELCTLALARHLGHPVGPVLANALEEITVERPYASGVLLVAPLGWIERTVVRRITLEDAEGFGRLHETVYREHGYELVPVAAASLAVRADAVEGLLRDL